MLSHFHFGLDRYLPTILYIGMFVAFLLSILRNPKVGLYVLVFTLPLQTGRYRLHEFPLGAQVLDILLLGSIIGLLIKRKEVIPRSSWAGFLLMIAIFYYLLLWQGSLFIDVPFPLWISDERFSDWKNYVEMFLLALVIPSAFKEKKDIRNLVVVMCFSVLVVNRSYMSLLGSRDLSHFSYDVRDAGPLGYAGVNGLAAFEAMFVSFLVGIYSAIKKTVAKMGIAVLIATSGYCLLYAFSRGGYVGLMAGLAVIGILRTRWLLGALLVVLLAWQFLLPTSVQERIMMTRGDARPGEAFDSSAETRIVLWRDALDLFLRNPVTGTGFGTYQFMGRVESYRDTHNYYIKVLAETGIIGLGLFLTLQFRLAQAGARLFYGSDDAFWKGIGLGFLALISSAVILNFFGDRWTYQQVDGYLWVILGFVIRGSEVVNKANQQVEPFELDSSDVIVPSLRPDLTGQNLQSPVRPNSPITKSRP